MSKPSRSYGPALLTVLVLLFPIVIVVIDTISLRLPDLEDRSAVELSLSQLEQNEPVGGKSIRCIFVPTQSVNRHLSARFKNFAISRWTDSRDNRIWSIADVDLESRTISVKKLIIDYFDIKEFQVNGAKSDLSSGAPCGTNLRVWLNTSTGVVTMLHADFFVWEH